MKAGPRATVALEPRELRKEAAVKEFAVWLGIILLELWISVQFVVIQSTADAQPKAYKEVLWQESQCFFMEI